MLLIFSVYGNLIVSGIGIYETEELVTGRCIHKLVNSGKRETIFWVCLVQICEVNAGSPLFILFLDEDKVRHPSWIVGLPDKFVGRITLNSHGPLLLTNWLMVGIDVESMQHYVRIYSYHIFVVPSKHIQIYLEEIGQLGFYLEGETLAQLETSFSIDVTDHDILLFVYWVDDLVIVHLAWIQVVTDSLIATDSRFPL